ncbi:MAG: carotenoid biosynthesis protein [Myxococcales bacterium]|nr:carotenoid biosynthesis protein [Myxococcales bacterium]
MELQALRRGYELGLPLLFAVVAWRVARRRGVAPWAREAAFGFALSQGVELLAVGLGRYSYPDWLLYFPPRPAWVPLGIGLGWAALVPVVMRISEGILGPGASRPRLAVLDGLLAVGVDLVIDPAVSGEPLRMWMWTGEGMVPYRHFALGVPVFNFVGWFLLVGACSLQLRGVEARCGARGGWARLAAWLALDLALAAGVMLLPWW